MIRSSTQRSPEFARPVADSAPVEFDLFDLLLAFAANKTFILVMAAVGLGLGALMAVLTPRLYTATAVIMPPQQGESSQSLLGQLGAGSVAGLGGAFGLKNQNDMYIGILRSHTVADDLIKRFDLKNVYGLSLESKVRDALEGNTKIESGRDSLIHISVTDGKAKRAADIANGFVDELYNLNNHLAISEASERRLFFERQLAAEKDRLADAEVALKKTEEATGVIQPSGQTETIIRQVAQLQADITSHEVQLDALRTSSTEQNPEVIRLNTELAGLRAQLRDMQSGANGKHVPGDITLSSARVPEAGLEYVRKSRDVQYHQLLFDLLARQYEAARMDEAKAAPVIQVVDPATVPDWKSWPPRLRFGILGLLAGLFVACSFTLFAFTSEQFRRHSGYVVRMAELRRTLGLRA